ncbi:MAG: ABC transporter permease [Deltaproteobacteria bacterium]|nr:ABC transporter permease [Deltaproteobacteria bacterium]
MHLVTRAWLVLRMGARNVFRYRRRSAISGFAIALAVMLMVCIRGLVNGSETMVFEQMVLGQFGALQVHKTGFVANVTKPPLSFAFPVDAALMQKVKSVPGVVDAAARITFASMVAIGDKSVPAPVVAIDPDNEYKVCPLKTADVAIGKPLTGDGAVMTPMMRRQLGADVGSEITLLSQDAEGVMNAGLAKAHGFLADIPLLTSSKKLLFVSLKTAQDLLRLDGQALVVAVRLQDYSAPDAAADALRAKLGPKYEVHTWRDLTPTLVDSLAERRVILNFVTGVFLFIALIGVALAMLMSVLGRTREIGTMMAVGMRRRQIVSLFISEALVLGVTFSIIGSLIGEAIVHYFNWRGLGITIPGGATTVMLRPTVEWIFVARTALIVAMGSVAASIYPARAASRLKPIAAMGAL